MGVFFVYMLKSSACLAGFYLFYRLLLSKETFHRFNRIALLALLLLSLLLPLIQLTTTQQTEMHQTMLTIEQLLMMADMPASEVTQAEGASVIGYSDHFDNLFIRYSFFCVPSSLFPDPFAGIIEVGQERKDGKWNNFSGSSVQNFSF